MAVVFVEGFEKHSPANQTFGTSLFDGSTTYDAATASLLKDWSTFTSGGNGAHVSFQLGRGAAAASRSISWSQQSGGAGTLRRSTPTLARGIAGAAIYNTFFGNVGFSLLDSGTIQMQVWIDVNGRVVVARNGTALYTSTAYVMLNSWNYIELDVTISNSVGAYQVWLNGVSLTSATGQNTRATANNSFNQFALDAGAGGVAFDDVYLFDGTGVRNNSARGDSQVQTLFPSSDSSVQFTAGNYAIGYFPRQTLNTTNAPGANTLTLVPIVPEVNCTLNSVQMNMATTSAGAKVKGVVYSDSSNAPGSLLSDGTEVVGTTASTNTSLPLVTPQALTGGTRYWVGFYSDTSLTIGVSEATYNLGQKKANTYGSGAAAGPLAGMTTGQGTWQIWGVASGAASNYALADASQVCGIVNALPAGYLTDGTVGHEDLYETQNLSGSMASVACVQVSGILSKDSAGTKTVDLRVKSGSTDSAGSSPGNALATTPSQFASVFETDPDTAAAWTSSGVNAMKAGYQINT